VNLLLDTHVWLWSVLSPKRISPKARKLLLSAESELWLSPISAWEALMLAECGRLAIRDDAGDWVASAWRAAPFREAPLTYEVAVASRQIPVPVRDPADRFLVATAKVYGCALLTADRRLRTIPGVEVVRA